MPTDGFKELVLATFPVKKAVRIFRTSGTTRESKGAHFFDTLKLYEAAILPNFEQYILSDRKKRRFFFLTSSPDEARDSSLSYMMGAVNRHFSKPEGTFYVRGGKILSERLARDLRNEKGPVVILATAFSLQIFLESLKSKKLALQLVSGSRLMETGGFKGKAKQISKTALYKECRERLGIRPECCVSEYGMTELSSQFYSVNRQPFQGPAWTRTLVIDPATGKEAKKGEKGLLRHFDLANLGSVMAIQTEDVGIARDGGFELLGRAPEADIRGCSMTYEEFLLS